MVVHGLHNKRDSLVWYLDCKDVGWFLYVLHKYSKTADYSMGNNVFPVHLLIAYHNPTYLKTLLVNWAWTSKKTLINLVGFVNFVNFVNFIHFLLVFTSSLDRIEAHFRKL